MRRRFKWPLHRGLRALENRLSRMGVSWASISPRPVEELYVSDEACLYVEVEGEEAVIYAPRALMEDPRLESWVISYRDRHRRRSSSEELLRLLDARSRLTAP